MTDEEQAKLEYSKSKSLIDKTYVKKHRQEVYARHRKYWAEHPEYRKSMSDKYRAKNQTIKAEVLIYYGNGKASCILCGESRLACLSIDHIDSDGGRHRREINNINIYHWLRKNNLPKGYRTLCMNCQFIKREEKRECTGRPARIR